MGDDEAALLRLWREKSAAKPSPRTCPATSSSSSAKPPRISTGAGSSAIPARNRPTQCAQCLFAFFGCLKLPEAHARPAPILVDEFDPGASQAPFQSLRERCRIHRASGRLQDWRSCSDAGRSPPRGLARSQSRARPSHPNLCTCQALFC